VIILKQDQRGLICFFYLSDERLSKGLVHRDIAILPGIVDLASDIGARKLVPHIMLKEPEHRVANVIVVFMVSLLWAEDKTEGKLSPCGGGREAPNFGHLRSLTVSLAHGSSDPGELCITAQGKKGGDHSSPAKLALELAILGYVVFYRTSIAGNE
jgi:hypothetical protein